MLTSDVFLSPHVDSEGGQEDVRRRSRRRTGINALVPAGSVALPVVGTLPVVSRLPSLERE